MTLEIPSGADIRVARKQVGLSQSKLADEADMSQGMVSRIERDDVDPTLSTMQELADVINKHE